MNRNENIAPVISSFRQLYPFSESELAMIVDRLQTKEYKKSSYLLKKGAVCKGLTFILSGSMRQYSDTEKGDITIRFFIEHNWVVDYQSFMGQKPSDYDIEVMEPCTVLYLDIDDIHQLIGTNPSFFTLGKLFEHGTDIRSQVDYKKTPDERYKHLLETRPEWIQRFSLTQIASYLGISPETLSRVRSRI